MRRQTQDRPGKDAGRAGCCSGDAGAVRLLFTHEDVPNCAVAKRALEEARVEYQVVDAEENKEMARKYQILSAPTLVVLKEGGVEKLTNASNIRKYVLN